MAAVAAVARGQASRGQATNVAAMATVSRGVAAPSPAAAAAAAAEEEEEEEEEEGVDLGTGDVEEFASA